MLTEKQKDYLMMEAEERVYKDRQSLIFFICAQIFIEFVLVMLVLNKSDIYIGFIIANVVMVLYLVNVIIEYRNNPYRHIIFALAEDNYTLDTAYLKNVKEVTYLTRNRKVRYTGKFVGCVYAIDEKMDIIADFVMEHTKEAEYMDREVLMIKFPEVKDKRKGYRKEFTLLYLAEK